MKSETPSETAPQVTVRRCRPDDIDAVLALWAGARNGHASSPDRREDVDRLLAASPGALLVALDAHDVVIGTVIAAWDGWRGNLYRLSVAEGRRRRGIGQSLVEAAEDHLSRCGCRRVTALVAHEDERAGPFWDAAGYPRDTAIGRRVKNL